MIERSRVRIPAEAAGDILVSGCTQQEHDQRLKKVLQRLEGAGVTLNKSVRSVSSFWDISSPRKGCRWIPLKVIYTAGKNLATAVQLQGDLHGG